MTRHLKLPLIIIVLTLFGAFLMHLFRLGYATAADLETGVDAGAVAYMAPEQPSSPAPGPTVTSDSAPEEVAAAAWWALRAGYLGPALLFAVFAAGMYARQKRGYIVKRWPQLDDGRAWAVLIILTVAAGTLVPLAAANALTRDAVWAAIVGSVGLYMLPTPKPAAQAGGAA
jgi:hypothetical protein